MERKAHYTVVGDEISDCYYFGKMTDRFTVSSHINCDGGATNVWANLSAILGEIVNSEMTVCFPYTGMYTSEIDRYVGEANNIVFEAVRNPSKPYDARDRTKMYWPKSGRQQVLVLADYNKGAICIGEYPLTPPKNNYKLCVADSRYRTLDLNLIKTSAVKIWHASELEYDDEFAKNFDYVVWSRGHNQVQVFDTKGLTDETQTCEVEFVEVPPVKVVCTIGAGDTMVAALAAYLGELDGPITLQAVANATEFAVRCCQDVVQQPYTAITKEKL